MWRLSPVQSCLYACYLCASKDHASTLYIFRHFANMLASHGVVQDAHKFPYQPSIPVPSFWSLAIPLINTSTGSAFEKHVATCGVGEKRSGLAGL